MHMERTAFSVRKIVEIHGFSDYRTIVNVYQNSKTTRTLLKFNVTPVNISEVMIQVTK